MRRFGFPSALLLGAAIGALFGLLSARAADAQEPLPRLDPAGIAVLAYRPAGNEQLLIALQDPQHRLRALRLHASADGKVTVLQTLAGAFTAVTWLDGEHVGTGGDDGRLQSWPIDGGDPVVLARLGEPIAGIGVAPASHSLAIRLGQTLRLFGADGLPNGPTITLGRPTRPSDVCPPDGIEQAAAFAPDERLIVFAGLCGDLRVVGRDGTRLMHADVARGPASGHAFSTDGKTLAVTYRGPTAVGTDFWPVAPGRLGNPRPLAAVDEPFDIAALPDRPGFALLSADRLRLLAPDGGALGVDIDIPAARKMAVAADGTRIALAAGEGLVLLDGNGKRLQARPFDSIAAAVSAVSIANGSQFAVLSREGRLRVWRLDGTETRPPTDLWNDKSLAGDANRQAPRLLTSPNGRLVAVSTPNGLFEVFDESWSTVGRPMRFPPDAGHTNLNATILLDDRVLRPLSDGSGLVALGFDGRLLGRIELGGRQKPAALAAAAEAANRIAVFFADRRLAIFQSDGRPLGDCTVDAPGPGQPALAVAADGSAVALYDPADSRAGLVVWRLREGSAPERRDGAFLRFLPDGSLLRLSKGRVVLDAPNGATRLSVGVDADSIETVSADGKVALVTKNGIARVVRIALDQR